MFEATDVLLVLANDTLLDEQLEQQAESEHRNVFYPFVLNFSVPGVSIFILILTFICICFSFDLL